MTLTRLAWLGLRFHWRRHAAAGLGAAVSGTLLVGALVVGDSVRARMQEIALARLGRAEVAIDTGGPSLRPELAADLAAATGTKAAAVLRLAGTAASADGGLTVGRVEVLGVDRDFWDLDVPSGRPTARAGAVVANRRLAARLALRPGDEIVLRVESDDPLHIELPVNARRSTMRPLRLTVDAVSDDTGLGRFSLGSEAVPPPTVFVPRAQLASSRGGRDGANLILLASGSRRLVAADVVAGLRRTVSLEDLQLDLHRTRDGRQLVSARFFLPPETARAALRASAGALGTLAYFVDTLRSSAGEVPYSFVAAPGPQRLDGGMQDDEIVIGVWLARELRSGVGDSIEVVYHEPDAGTRLVSRSARFRVRRVVPTSQVADAALVPPLPGLTDAASCRSWDATLPLDLRRVRRADEDYWTRYRTGPKAFVTLAAAQRLWSSRHGNLTAVGFPAARTGGGAGAADGVEAALRAAIDPLASGWRVVALREQAFRAAEGTTDFGLLLLGLNAFLIASALAFVGLFQALAVVRRSREWRTLAALGLSPRQVRRLVLLEGIPVALAGSLAGAGLARVYAANVLRAMPGVLEASGTLGLSFDPVAVAVGTGLNAAIGIIVMAAASRRALRNADRRPGPGSLAPRARNARRVRPAVVLLGFLLAGGLRAWPAPDGRTAAALVWCAGAAALAAGLVAAGGLVERLGEARLARPYGLGLRAMSRQRRRTLTLVGVLALVVFVVIVVALGGGERQLPPEDVRSGTGGFAFFGETALPIRHDLRTGAGREALGIGREASAQFVPLRVREGDDASCRNLNRSQTPRIIGVDAAALAARGSFGFSEGLRGVPQGWAVLEEEAVDGAIPAIADANVIAWGFGLKVGDVLDVPATAAGAARLRLVSALEPSLFQGTVLISERHFERLFPTVVGHTAFLVDAAPETRESVAEALRLALRDHGLELVPTSQRLADLHEVQRAYVSLFLALGGLGLAFGTAATAAVVARDVVERRGELACLRAMGFSASAIERVLAGEHATVFAIGVAVGAAAGAVAAGTGLTREAAGAALSCVLIALTGFVAARLASRLALRQELTGALRRE